MYYYLILKIVTFASLNLQFMNLKKKTEAFARLGGILRDALSGSGGKVTEELESIAERQYLKNEWFTSANVRFAIEAVADELTQENLYKWTLRYPELENQRDPVNVGVVMAGNIPLAGFHDFLCVLISGNNLIARTSTKDSEIMVWIAGLLCSLEPEFSDRITFTEDRLSGFEAVIATGSDNTSRYFEYYFGRYPHIIRKNRNSIAILEGDESEKEISGLGHDIFSYFGLGCRNVSKIYIPEGYDFARLAGIWTSYENIIRHRKYANNYDFSKAVYMVNREQFFDTGYLLIKENTGLSSPVAVLYYEQYKSLPDIEVQIETCKDKIQCITGRGQTCFGDAQRPHLWDYADGIDTIEFLLKKNSAGIL